MTDPRYVPVEDLRSGDARDLARIAQAHSWIVDCVQNDPWSGEPECLDETVSLRLIGDTHTTVLFAYYQAVDSDGGVGLFFWRMRTETFTGGFVSATDRQLDRRELLEVITTIGIIDLRVVA